MAASNQLVKEKVNVPIQNPSHERVVDFGEFTVILREKSTKYSSLEKIKQNTDTISLTAFAGWMSGLENRDS